MLIVLSINGELFEVVIQQSIACDVL